MIIDQLSNVSSDFYAGLLTKHGGSFQLADRLMTAFRFLQNFDPNSAQPGTTELDGKQVFAMVQHYDTKPRSKGFWEAHRKYIDVQYVAQGQELMGYVNLGHVQAGEYDASKDFLPAEGEGNFLLMPAGTFIILTPQDVHMPQVAVNDQPSPVKKVVVKVAVADQ